MFRLLGALFLLPPQTLSITTNLTAWRRARDISADDLPSCSCDCCDVVNRSPGEVLNEVRVKCSPSSGHSTDLCGELCAPSEEDAVLGSAAQNGMLDYQRFCFFECKPVDGRWRESPPGTQCVALEDAEAHHVLDAHGNAMDPATLFGLQGTFVRSALLSTGKHLGEVSSAAGPAPAPQGAGADEPSPEEVGKTIKEVAKGRQQAQDRQKAAQTAAKEAMKLSAQIGKSDPLAAIRTIENAADRSQKAAARSRYVARQAGKTASRGQRNAWEDALSAADVEINHMRQEARLKAEADAYVPKPWREYASEVAAKAAKPYLEPVRQAQQVAEQWNLRASEAVKEAKALHEQALQKHEEVEAFVKAGKQHEAAQEGLMVKHIEDRSKTLMESAQQMHGSAKEAAKSASGWYKTAQEAAQRAVAEMKFPPEKGEDEPPP